jgi:hypothetical protein
VSLIPKRVTETVDNAADKLASTASDTKRAVVACAALASVAFVLAAVALVLAVIR